MILLFVELDMIFFPSHGDFVDFIISGGGRIKKFDSFEEFEQAMDI